MFFLCAVMCVLFSCTRDSVITVGFLGPLEGKYSDLGVQGRNGAQLALEEANAQGGVLGSTFRLVARDDGNTPEGALAAMEKLAQAHAKVVIGPMISAMAKPAQTVAEIKNIVLISPTVSTPDLTGQRDNFFRVVPENVQWAQDLAHHGKVHEQLSTAVVLTDLDNAAYSQPFIHAFTQSFTQLGGTVLKNLEIHSTAIRSWDAVATEIAVLRPDVLVIGISARDAATLAKTFVSRGEKPHVYCSMWAATRELAVDGGNAAAGWIFGTGYSADNRNPAYLSFKHRYARRFGFEPNFAAALSFEAALAFLESFRHARGNFDAVPEALAGLQNVQGVISPFSLDENGDVLRESYIVTFNGSEFHTLATVHD